MSVLLQRALPIFDKLHSQLSSDDWHSVELACAKWLPQENPRKAQSLKAVHKHVNESLRFIRLHKFLPDVPASYKQALAWVKKEKFRTYKVLAYCQLAELYPAKASDCLKAVRKKIRKDEQQGVYKRVALVFRAPEYAEQVQDEETRCNLYLQMCLRGLSSDCKTALDCFKMATATKLNSKTILDRASRCVVEAFSLKVANQDAFLTTYLDLIDRHSSEQKKKYARALFKKIVAINPEKALAATQARVKMNMTTAHMCLVVAESSPPETARILLQKTEECLTLLPNTLASSETALHAARCYGKLGCHDKKEALLAISMRHIAAQLNEEMAIYYARRALIEPACIDKVDESLLAYDVDYTKFKKRDPDLYKERMHVKLKIARILHPQYRDKALTLLFETLPTTEIECCVPWRLDAFFGKLHKFKGSYDVIRARILTVYRQNSEQLQAYTLASLAERMEALFPEEAKELYELADVKYSRVSDNKMVDYKIAIAKLSGEHRDKMLMELLETLRTRKDDISACLKKIILAMVEKAIDPQRIPSIAGK